jgi:hypothetical protein
MDENAVRSLLMVAASDEDAPPCEISIPLARSRAHRRLRLRRVYLPGAAPVAAAVAVTLVLTLSSVLGGAPGPSALGTVRPRAASPAVAPRVFNPLVPYASFGWLPAGFSAQASAGVTDQATSRAVTLQAAAPATDGRLVQVSVDAAGSCRIEPTSVAMPKAAGDPEAPTRTLSCTDPSAGAGNRFAELASAGPDVNGTPSYWTPEGALEWQYAPGAWAEAMPMDNPACYAPGAAACTGVAGWVSRPASLVFARSRFPGAKLGAVRPEVQSAASKTLLLEIAAGLQYGDTTPLVFGFELAGLPAGWLVASDYSYAPQDGRLAASGLSAGPAVDPTALGISVGPAVTPTSGYGCKVIPGQTGDVTVDGAPAVFRNLNEQDKQFQSLCANDMDGVSLYVEMDLNTPGSNAPLPGGAEVSSVLTLFQSVRLLGPDPAAWVTDPLG